MIGVVITTVSGLLLQRVATAIRQEQMIGTLEALLVTPTSPTTVQAGSVAFDLLFIPVRMGLLLTAVAITLGLGYEPSGMLPSLVLLAVFVPFVWGLGLVTAAAIVTFRRGEGVLGVTMSVLGLASGAFFPLALLPDWIQTLAEANPVAIAMEGTREALIGGAGWGALGPDLLVLGALSVAALFAGVTAFRAALGREHRRGTLGLY
jgi:ABC-2 type transport system permease protein